MKRAALAIALVTASSGIASAGGYIGLGVGTAPATSDSNANRHFDFEENGRSARLIGGYRFGRFAIEGAFGGHDVMMQLQERGTYYPSEIRYGSISGKYNLPLADGFEAFGRLGLQHTSLARETKNTRFDSDGNGMVFGLGIEYRVPVAGVSVWIDYQYTRTSLEGESTDMDLSTRMWTVGASIGF